MVMRELYLIAQSVASVKSAFSQELILTWNKHLFREFDPGSGIVIYDVNTHHVAIAETVVVDAGHGNLVNVAR